MQKIEAIKIVRQITNLGLRESKDLVEAITPLVQMTQTAILDHVQALNYNIKVRLNEITFRTMTVEDLSWFKKMIEERDRYKALTY